MTDRAHLVRIRLQLNAVSSSMSAARRCWMLVDTAQLLVIADLIHSITQRYQLSSGISLYLDDHWLPPGESTLLLKDGDIIKLVSNSRTDHLNYDDSTTPSSKRARVSSSSNSSSSSSSDDDGEETVIAVTQHSRTERPVKPVNLKSNTKTLTTGATLTVFKDSSDEDDGDDSKTTNAITATLENTFSTPIIFAAPVSVNSSVEAQLGSDTNRTKRNRRSRNRKKKRSVQQQIVVGGEDDVLVAVSRVFENPADTAEDNGVAATGGSVAKELVSELGASASNLEDNGDQELATNMAAGVEVGGDDFGVVFTADFDSYPVLSGLPRVGDLLAYKELEISLSYAPEVSAYKVCKVLSLDPDQSNIINVQLSHTTYKDECTKASQCQQRKFDLDESVTDLPEVSIMKELALDKLHCIRLIQLPLQTANMDN